MPQECFFKNLFSKHDLKRTIEFLDSPKNNELVKLLRYVLNENNQQM